MPDAARCYRPYGTAERRKTRIHMGQYPVTGSGPDCKSGASQLSWFDSNLTHHFSSRGGISMAENKQEEVCEEQNKCFICNKPIPPGREFCDECEFLLLQWQSMFNY